MRILKMLTAVFILTQLAFSWTIAKVNGQDYYTQDSQNKTILKQAVLGAGVGAISAGASGGSAGTGALIGAGTNVIGSAVLDTLTSSPNPQPQVQYVQQQPQPQVYYADQGTERGYTYTESAPRNGGCGRRR